MDASEELEDVLEEGCLPFGYPAGKRRPKLQAKNRSAITGFLGTGRRYTQVGVVPHYYTGLLAWALKRYMERSGWQAERILGYHAGEPLFEDVATATAARENLLKDGQILASLGTRRLIVTVDLHSRGGHSICVEGPARQRKGIDAFIEEVLNIARTENFYRGHKLEYDGDINFLQVKERAWESIILDAGSKREIRANTVEFLQKSDLWDKFGIPARRGVLLCGEPGTGKTIICRALMGEAGGMTCLAAKSCFLDAEGYISHLYEMAQDLAPCLVFIEDIDLIGQERTEFGYTRGPALLSLLAEMDGVEAQKQIVTVATTNCLALLDKALSQRPSRFDRIVVLKRPALAERLEMVRRLCLKIPLDGPAQEYIAQRSEGCTPAQIQEIIFGLAVEYSDNPAGIGSQEIDHILTRLSGRHGHKLGFAVLADEGMNTCSRLAINSNEGADDGAAGE